MQGTGNSAIRQTPSTVLSENETRTQRQRPSKHQKNSSGKLWRKARAPKQRTAGEEDRATIPTPRLTNRSEVTMPIVGLVGNTLLIKFTALKGTGRNGRSTTQNAVLDMKHENKDYIGMNCRDQRGCRSRGMYFSRSQQCDKVHCIPIVLPYTQVDRLCESVI